MRLVINVPTLAQVSRLFKTVERVTKAALCVKEVRLESVTALLADRPQHPRTNLALDALWLCFPNMPYTLCR
jgi:hypothetical protein